MLPWRGSASRLDAWSPSLRLALPLQDQLHTSAKQAQQLQDQLQAKEGEVAAARREAADEREQLRREVEVIKGIASCPSAFFVHVPL